MEGVGDLMTLSISQVQLKGGKANFNYFDLLSGKNYKLELNKNEFTHV
jgi:hypothetical protein